MTERALQLDLIGGPYWRKVTRFDPRAVALADRHYSRQQPGTAQFMPSGRVLVLLGCDALAVWGVCENMDPAGGRQWRCTIFRNETARGESARLSSALIVEATERTFDYWSRRHGAPPRFRCAPRSIRTACGGRETRGGAFGARAGSRSARRDMGSCGCRRPGKRSE